MDGAISSMYAALSIAAVTNIEAIGSCSDSREGNSTGCLLEVSGPIRQSEFTLTGPALGIKFCTSNQRNLE